MQRLSSEGKKKGVWGVGEPLTTTAPFISVSGKNKQLMFISQFMERFKDKKMFSQNVLDMTLGGPSGLLKLN